MAVGELQPPSQVDPLLGKVVSDRYRVIKKLGEGGMGAVYLVEHVFIEKKVALKVLAPELSRKADLTARFLQEAKSASRIGHENVIDISDFGQSPEGFVYFAMEYLQGQDLGQVVRAEGAMSWRRARPIILQICKALGAAHAKGIVHRDMKPENVFLIERGGRPDFVKLLDFGIAKVQSADGEGPKLTQTGMIFGTPEYMAPEQAEGKACDQRADIYAVGCVIHHLIVGEPPFSAENFVGMLTKHLLEQPKPPSSRQPSFGITPEMDALVLKSLAKKPEERFQSMAELMAAVEAIAESAAPRASVAEKRAPGPSNLTRPLGGSDGMPIIATSGRVSHTDMIAASDVRAERTELAAPKGNAKLWLVVSGLILGAAVALGAVLMGRGSTPSPAIAPASSPPTAVVAPVPVPPVQAPPAVAPPVEAPSEAPEAPAEPAPTAKRPKPEAPSPRPRRIVAPDDNTPATTQKPPKDNLVTPAELKGFPGE